MVTRFVFPGGRFDRLSLELEVEGRRHRLEPKHGETLALLLERAGEVVTKEELLQRVWAGRHVTDDALVVTIYKLRRVLADRARSPRYIETIAKRGYRWIAAPVSAAPAPTESTTPAPPGTVRRWLAMLAVPLLAAILWIAWPVSDPVSTDDELEGARALLAERSPSALERALEILDWHLLEEPGDGEAQALRAQALVFIAEGNPVRRPELIAAARKATRRALVESPTSPQANLAEGLLALFHERDPERAGLALQRSLRRTPKDPQLLAASSWWLSVQGRHDAALGAARRSLMLDPSGATGWSDLAYLAAAANQPNQSLRAAEIALGLDPASNAAAWERVRALSALGRSQEGIADYLEYLAGAGVDPASLAALEGAASRGGWPAFHRLMVNAFPEDRLLVQRAVIALRRDDRDGALGLLTRAVDRGDWETLWMASLPELRPLRGHPRFAALQIRLGLTPGRELPPWGFAGPAVSLDPFRSLHQPWERSGI
ncbi:MAG: winged helix-turn-helix domain-containing protein [Acidobacteriota bacterium]